MLLSVTSAIGSTNGRTPQYLYNLAANRRQVNRNISDMPYVHPALLRYCLHKCSSPTENPSQARTPFPRRPDALKRHFWNTVIVTLELSGVAKENNDAKIDRLFMISCIRRHQIATLAAKSAQSDQCLSLALCVMRVAPRGSNSRQDLSLHPAKRGPQTFCRCILTEVIVE